MAQAISAEYRGPHRASDQTDFIATGSGAFLLGFAVVEHRKKSQARKVREHLLVLMAGYNDEAMLDHDNDGAGTAVADATTHGGGGGGYAARMSYELYSEHQVLFPFSSEIYILCLISIIIL